MLCLPYAPGASSGLICSIRFSMKGSRLTGPIIFGSWFRVLLLPILCALASAADSPSSDVVMMKQFVVEATRIDEHPWLYVALPDYEILSRCDSGQTEAVARHIYESIDLEKRLVPGVDLAPLATPMTLIMFDHQPSQTVAGFLPERIKPEADLPNFGDVIQPGRWMTGGIDTCDSDTHCVVQNRWKMKWDWAGGGLGRGPIPTGLLFQLDQCVPPLPRWFEYGFIGPCGLLRMARARDPKTGELRGMIVAAPLWISAADTKALLAASRKSGAPPQLPPVQDLFRPMGASEEIPSTTWPSAEWMAEAALFLRWGLFPDATADTGHEKAFASFIERSRTEPVTETMFRECFGFGYEHMQTELGHYLVTTAEQPELLGYPFLGDWPPRDSEFLARTATTDEIGRILGDWLRMQGDSLHVANPELHDAYLRVAGRILERAYREDNGLPPGVDLLPAGEFSAPPSNGRGATPAVVRQPLVVSADKIHDARLQAVYGLYAYDVGDTKLAHALLVAATNAAVPRPAAYLVLARLNFQEAEAYPAANANQYSAGQVAGILGPLLAIIKRSWKLEASGYKLMADTWTRSVVKPSRSNLAVLLDGIDRYPLDSSLVCSVAKLCAQWGYVPEAEQVIDRGLKVAGQDATRQLLSLRTSLQAIK